MYISPQLMVKCLDEAKTIRSEETVRAYANGLRVLAKYFSDNDIENMTMDAFIHYANWLPSNGYAKKTNEVYYAGMRYFLEWLIVNNYIEVQYADMLRLEQCIKRIRRKREIRLPRFPQRDTADKLLEAIRLIAHPSPIIERNIAIMEFLVSTGCRNNELCKLKIKDINLDELSAIVIGKGRERLVYFNQSTKEALSEYWKARGSNAPTEFVFARHDRGAGKNTIKQITSTTIRNIFKEAVNKAGVDPKTSPHYMRHAYAIKMLNGTKNLSIVQDLLGHASPESTRVYAKIRSDDLEQTYRDVFSN